jgi:hypothetical protein
MTGIPILMYQQNKITSIEQLCCEMVIIRASSTFASTTLVAEVLHCFDPTIHNQYSRTCHFRVSARLSVFTTDGIEVCRKAKTMQS